MERCIVALGSDCEYSLPEKDEMVYCERRRLSTSLFATDPEELDSDPCCRCAGSGSKRSVELRGDSDRGSVLGVCGCVGSGGRFWLANLCAEVWPDVDCGVSGGKGM